MNSSEPFTYKPGVYILWHKNEPVYVGMSKYVGNRVNEHRRLGKVFDLVQFVEVENKKKRSFLEKALIGSLQPKLNIADKDTTWNLDVTEWSTTTIDAPPIQPKKKQGIRMSRSQRDKRRRDLLSRPLTFFGLPYRPSNSTTPPVVMSIYPSTARVLNRVSEMWRPSQLTAIDATELFDKAVLDIVPEKPIGEAEVNDE